MDIESNIILNVMKYLIVAASLVMCYAEIMQAVKYRHQPWSWVKWALGGMALYWAFYYTQSILGGLLSSHQIWVRSPLLLTISLVAANAIMSLRRVR